ncbi:hypothetical protein [Streptomyces sp. NPDC056160]|uniref:hypothetical protein n=1 Tax=Streptomyces sp. NPDC056160 TaxID=3345731 RepID=UPI0035E2C540
MTGPDADELRVRYLLRVRRVRPFGHQEPPPMSDDEPRRAVTPTRVIPAGAPLPARAPEPGEVPPWRTPPPPPPPPPPVVPPPIPAQPGPAAQPLEVRHVHQVVLLWPDPEPEPSRWERFTAWLGRYVRPWHAVIALAGALVPIPGTSYSAATTWHYTVGLARHDFGVGWGYGFGLVPLALSAATVARRGGSPARLFFLTVTFVGSLAAFSWWDPVQALTGVPR